MSTRHSRFVVAVGIGLIVTALAGAALVTGARPAAAQAAPSASSPPAAGAAAAGGAVPPAMTGGLVDPNEYRIGPEDMLQISVWKNEALSRTVPVRPDGKITLPLLNDIEAAGYTPMQFKDLLAKKLEEYMPAPEVSVIVTDPRSFKVSVMGEVAKPGRFELKSRTTVLDLLAMAGGLNQFASKSKIAVLRPDGAKGMKRIPFNYSKAIAAGGEQENLYVQSGDIIVVP